MKEEQLWIGKIKWEHGIFEYWFTFKCYGGDRWCGRCCEVKTWKLCCENNSTKHFRAKGGYVILIISALATLFLIWVVILLYVCYQKKLHTRWSSDTRCERYRSNGLYLQTPALRVQLSVYQASPRAWVWAHRAPAWPRPPGCPPWPRGLGHPQLLGLLLRDAVGGVHHLWPHQPGLLPGDAEGGQTGGHRGGPAPAIRGPALLQGGAAGAPGGRHGPGRHGLETRK